jgi:CBS domain-containing protein/anti-sigma regulatory factor (Ser/Thr protein kinase)
VNMQVEGITKVQELIYSTKVETVMATEVVIFEPDMPLVEAKTILKSKRISGAPVVEDENLIGILSMSDVLMALENNKLDQSVREAMTPQVKTVSKDSYLIEAVNQLGRMGFGRLPVVDGGGKLVGIVTPGTMMRSLLHEMDASFLQKETEKLPAYRASHIFDDIVSDATSLVLHFRVDDRDFSNAGKASSTIKKSLRRLGVAPAIIRRVSVAVYEAEMNLVIHTDVGGQITVEVRRDRLKISAVDHGPGIQDVKKVLQPGYTTAPQWIRAMGFGAGMGLANIKRCSDFMTLMSEPGVGTRLEILFRFGAHALGGRTAIGKRA